MVREIEEEGERVREGRPVVGVAKILSQDPFKPPSKATKKSSRKRFHVKGKKARAALWAELNAFLAEYREASGALRSGDLEAASRFPAGSYPPALAFEIGLRRHRRRRQRAGSRSRSPGSSSGMRSPW